jgi:hypothetical protein
MPPEVVPEAPQLTMTDPEGLQVTLTRLNPGPRMSEAVTVGETALMVENCLSISEGFSPVLALTSNRPPSRGAARQAFKNYIAENPDKWGLPWHQVVALSLSETFPCSH